MDPEPATGPDIGRYKKVPGLRLGVVVLRAGRRVQPQGNAPVTVMVDYIRGKGFAAHPKVGRAVRDELLGLRKREANLPNRLVDTPGQPNVTPRLIGNYLVQPLRGRLRERDGAAVA